MLGKRNVIGEATTTLRQILERTNRGCVPEASLLAYQLFYCSEPITFDPEQKEGDHLSSAGDTTVFRTYNSINRVVSQLRQTIQRCCPAFAVSAAARSLDSAANTPAPLRACTSSPLSSYASAQLCCSRLYSTHSRVA